MRWILALAVAAGSSLAAPSMLRAQGSGLTTVVPGCVPTPVPRVADGWPNAVTDLLGTVTSASITFPGTRLLSNDVGASLTIVSVGPASSGGGTVTGSDPFTFTFASGFSGADIFPYQIRDAAGQTTVGLVKVTAAGDTVFPSVSITAPAAGATVSASVLVTASATDNIGVAGVRFFDGTTEIGIEDTSTPFEATWDTTTATAGAHDLSAVARDAAGNITTSAVVTVNVSNAAPPDPRPAGLVLALAFDETTGTTANDASGNGNSGAISGATRTAAGKFGGALSFDGVDDWVTVADAASLDLTSGMTLEAWVKPSELSGWRTAILKERTGGLAYALYAHDDAPRPAAYVNVGGTDQTVAGAAALSTTQWSHIAATFDGAALRFYLNGALVGTTAISGPITTSDGVLRIGGNSVWGEYFSGSIDEVRVYNRALSSGEITADMNAAIGGGGTPPPPPATGLVLALSFNEATGTTAADASGNGNNGTVSGAARTAAGKFGGALSFDGVDDWVTVADAASLDLTTGMTLEAWVKPSALSGWRTAILKQSASGLVYALYAHDDAPRPAAYVNVGGVDHSVAGVAAVSTTDWTHIAATFDGSTFRFYVNGALEGEVTPAGPIATSNDVLRIGGNSVWGEYFAGLIDEVRVYDRALTGTDIINDMNTPIADR